MSASGAGMGAVVVMGLLISARASAGDPDYVNAAQKERCALGYQHRGGSICVPLIVPDHAHANASGHDWECDPGYQKEREACVRPRKPAAPRTCTDHDRSAGGAHTSNLMHRCE